VPDATVSCRHVFVDSFIGNLSEETLRQEIDDAEQRSRRVLVRQQMQEQKVLLKRTWTDSQRNQLMNALEQRNLPFDDSCPAVKKFCKGQTTVMTDALRAMEDKKREMDLDAMEDKKREMDLDRKLIRSELCAAKHALSLPMKDRLDLLQQICLLYHIDLDMEDFTVTKFLNGQSDNSVGSVVSRILLRQHYTGARCRLLDAR
jgi:hypothetical protein